jgi:hypothetical protein
MLLVPYFLHQTLASLFAGAFLYTVSAFNASIFFNVNLLMLVRLCLEHYFQFYLMTYDKFDNVFQLFFALLFFCLQMQNSARSRFLLNILSNL